MYFCPVAYEMVIGLEVHVQLRTRAKVFAPEAVTFGERPNTYISPISLGYPGTLPVLGKACLEAAIKLGLALGCEIPERFYFSRKNYFYPDLPKGYQITQEAAPIAKNGLLHVRLPSGEKVPIRILRLQLEEDTGKSLHDQDPFYTLLDYNRAGIGLIEIVSAPDIRSPEVAMAYVAQIRRLVRFLSISDGNMEEGSLRCDANISVRPVGSTAFGTRVEIKNLNSISALGKAIAYEFERQVRLIEAGEAVRQETRTWDGEVTLPLREKETADDYRYFPEPDLPPVAVHPAWKAQIAAELPELPEVLFDRLVEKEGLFPDEAVLIVEDLPYAVYFKALVEAGLPVKRAANWLNGPIRAHLNATATRMEDFPIPPAQIAALDTLVQEGLVSLNAAREVLFPALLEDPAADPKTLAETKGLLLVQDETLLRQWADTVLAQNPDKVQAYLAGKTGLLGFLVGQVVKLSQGKADPRRVSAYLQARLTKADKPA